MRDQISVTLEPGEVCKISFKATLREQCVYDVKCETVGRKVNIKVDGKRNVTFDPTGTVEIEKL